MTWLNDSWTLYTNNAPNFILYYPSLIHALLPSPVARFPHHMQKAEINIIGSLIVLAAGKTAPMMAEVAFASLPAGRTGRSEGAIVAHILQTTTIARDIHGVHHHLEAFLHLRLHYFSF